MIVHIDHEGHELQAHLSIHPAEPDVGIMSPFVEDVYFYNEEGTLLKISDEELEQWLNYDHPWGKKLHEAMERRYYGVDLYYDY